MPVELVERLCPEFPRLGTQSVVLISEGESLLHPKILEIIRLLKASGVRVTLFTNGTTLTEDCGTALVKTGLDILRVSYWGTGPEEWATNYPGTNPELLRRVGDQVRSLNKLKRAASVRNPRAILHYVINRSSHRGAPEVAGLAADLLFDEVCFSVFKPRKGFLQSHALTADEQRYVIRQLRKSRSTLRKHGLDHNIDALLLRYGVGEECWLKLPCYIGWVDARIKMDGSVLPCAPCDLIMGNLFQTSLEEIWNGPAFRRFREAAASRKGLAQLQGDCDCAYCCHVPTNQRIHRYARWLPGRQSDRKER
jgi:MoaA/NifB/PqqE/SkfB family radical SAM enzyme